MIELKAIKEVAATIKTGKTPPTNESQYFDGDVNWYTPGDLDKDMELGVSKRTLTKIAFEDKKAIIHKPGTLLVGCIGDIGKLGVTTMDCSSNQQLTGIYPKENLDVNYLYFWFRANKKILDSYSNNAVVPILNNRTLETIKIPLPPLAEQKKIAAILDAAAIYRQKTKALIAKYDELTQSLFLDMFGDPVRNPKGWEKKSLSVFIKQLNTGVSVNSTDKEYKEGELGILKTSCVYSGEFRPAEAKVIREDEHSRMKLNPTIDSIIVSRMNTTELVGKSAYISNDFPDLFLPDRLWQTEKGELLHNVRWLAYAISFRSFMNEIGSISSGTSGSMKNISKKNFLNLLLIYPDLNLQNQFAERVAAVEKQKAQSQVSLEKAEELFASLLQRAFKGELV